MYRLYTHVRIYQAMYMYGSISEQEKHYIRHQSRKFQDENIYKEIMHWYAINDCIMVYV